MTRPRTLIGILLIGAYSASAHAEPLGRLFHSTIERNALDALRKEKSLPPKPASAHPSTERPAPRLDGYVVRSDGKSTLWINGTAVAGHR